MTLAIPAMKTEIKTQLDAVYGAPADAGQQDKFLTAIATAFFNILTNDAIVILNNGADSNGDTLVDLTGGLS